ncbi:hypothetical protein GCM10028862_02320 [Luteimonas pelagia]
MSLFATLFLILLVVLWILVPFAIFGIKPLLKQLVAEQRRTNELLHLSAAQAWADRARP